MSHVFPRNNQGAAPLAVAGDGCYLIDSNGRRFFDGSSGAGISSLGHSNLKVAVAIKDQLARLAFAHTSFFTSEPSEELA